MNKFFILIVVVSAIFLIDKSEDVKKNRILNDDKKNQNVQKSSDKFFLISGNNLKSELKLNLSLQDLEKKFETLNSQEISNLYHQAQKELSDLDQTDYAHFSKEQLQSYNEVLRKRVVLKKIIFMRKYQKWAVK